MSFSPTRRLAVLLACLSLAAPQTALAQREALETSAGQLALEPFARGLVHPWGIAALPDGGFSSSPNGPGACATCAPTAPSRRRSLAFRRSSTEGRVASST